MENSKTFPNWEERKKNMEVMRAALDKGVINSGQLLKLQSKELISNEAGWMASLYVREEDIAKSLSSKV